MTVQGDAVEFCNGVEVVGGEAVATTKLSTHVNAQRIKAAVESVAMHRRAIAHHTPGSNAA